MDLKIGGDLKHKILHNVYNKLEDIKKIIFEILIAV